MDLMVPQNLSSRNPLIQARVTTGLCDRTCDLHICLDFLDEFFERDRSAQCCLARLANVR